MAQIAYFDNCGDCSRLMKNLTLLNEAAYGRDLDIRGTHRISGVFGQAGLNDLLYERPSHVIVNASSQCSTDAADSLEIAVMEGLIEPGRVIMITNGQSPNGYVNVHNCRRDGYLTEDVARQVISLL